MPPPAAVPPMLGDASAAAPTPAAALVVFKWCRSCWPVQSRIDKRTEPCRAKGCAVEEDPVVTVVWPPDRLQGVSPMLVEVRAPPVSTFAIPKPTSSLHPHTHYLSFVAHATLPPACCAFLPRRIPYRAPYLSFFLFFFPLFFLSSLLWHASRPTSTSTTPSICRAATERIASMVQYAHGHIQTHRKPRLPFGISRSP